MNQIFHLVMSLIFIADESENQKKLIVFAWNALLHWAVDRILYLTAENRVRRISQLKLVFFFNKHYAKNKQTVSQNKTSFTDLILYWFSLNYNKNITGRLWAWLYVKLPLWHSAYHMNTCLERRSAPQHQSWSEMITSCQAFHCYCPLNYYCLLVVCIIQYLIQYVWKQNKELCAIFTTIIPSRVLSVFAAQGAFCTRSEHHHLTQ